MERRIKLIYGVYKGVDTCQLEKGCAKLCRMTKKPQKWTLVNKISWGIEVISLGLSFFSYIVDIVDMGTELFYRTKIHLNIK